MDVLDHKEGWVLKNWCFWSVVLEKTFGSPLDCKEVKPINPKGNQPWIFIERTDAEAEASILWPPDAKSQLTGKDPDAGEEWGQKEKQATEDKITGWHHQLSGPEFEQTLELVKDREAWCATVYGVAESDMTGWLNWTDTYMHTHTYIHILSTNIQHKQVCVCIYIYIYIYPFPIIYITYFWLIKCKFTEKAFNSSLIMWNAKKYYHFLHRSVKCF